LGVGVDLVGPRADSRIGGVNVALNGGGATVFYRQSICSRHKRLCTDNSGRWFEIFLGPGVQQPNLRKAQLEKRMVGSKK